MFYKLFVSLGDHIEYVELSMHIVLLEIIAMWVTTIYRDFIIM